MLSPNFCFFLGAKHKSKQYQFCFGGFVIFSMKNASRVRLEPKTSVSMITARRANHLLEACTKSGWVSIWCN